MSTATCSTLDKVSTLESTADEIPSELLALQQRIQAQPASVRAELEPLITGAVEQARFRRNVLTLARDALQRFRTDLAMAEHDLQATRREREALKIKLKMRQADRN